MDLALFHAFDGRSLAITAKGSEDLKNVVDVGRSVVVQIGITIARAAKIRKQQQNVGDRNHIVLIQVFRAKVRKGLVGINDPIAVVVNAFSCSSSPGINHVVVVVTVACFEAQTRTQLTQVRNANSPPNAITVQVFIDNVVGQNARTIINGGAGIKVARKSQCTRQLVNSQEPSS